LFFSDLFKLLALFDAGDDGLGLVFFLYQNVPRTVLFAGVGGDKLIKLCLDVGIGHGVVLLKLGEQLTDQNALTSQFQLSTVIIGRIKPFLLRFLHEDFSGNDFVLDLAFHLRRYRATGARNLLSQGLDPGFGHSFAVHDGHILRKTGGEGAQSEHQSDLQMVFHVILLKG
jgi:hypothetical protein